MDTENKFSCFTLLTIKCPSNIYVFLDLLAIRYEVQVIPEFLIGLLTQLKTVIMNVFILCSCVSPEYLRFL